MNKILEEIVRHVIKECAMELGDRVEHWGETETERKKEKKY